MSKSFFSLILLVIFTSGYCQSNSDEEFEEILYGKKVFINKKVASVTLTKTKEVKGIEIEKDFKSNINNPYLIYISSNETQASIRINNKNWREDLFLNFKSIRSQTNSNEKTYNFVGDNFSGTYTIPKNGEHHHFYISMKDKESTGYTLFFIISKFDQL